MSTYRAYLAYSPAYERPNVWRLSDAGTGICARVRVASGPENIHELSFEELRLRAHDTDTWISAPLKLPEHLGRIEFVLRGAPEPVMAAMRAALEVATTGRPPPPDRNG